MSKERFDNALEAAYHEGQHYRQKAKQRALPPDPAGWLDEAEHYAHGLPDDLPQKRVILRQARQARLHLADGNEDEAKFFMLQIEENWSNAEHDKWVIGVDESATRARAAKAATQDRAIAVMVATIKAKGLKKRSPENRPAFTAALKEAGITDFSETGQYKKWVRKAFSEAGE